MHNNTKRCKQRTNGSHIVKILFQKGFQMEDYKIKYCRTIQIFSYCMYLPPKKEDRDHIKTKRPRARIGAGTRALDICRRPKGEGVPIFPYLIKGLQGVPQGSHEVF